MNLREHKGYTYGAYSNLDARRLAGTFRATAEVRTSVTVRLCTSFSASSTAFATTPCQPKRLPIQVLSYGRLPIRIETQDGLIDQYVNIKMFDLPDNYLKAYRDQVNAVTTEDIQRVAQQYVTPDRAAIVIVGDAAEVTEQIKPYSEAIEITIRKES